MKKKTYIIATFLAVFIYLIYLKLMQIHPFGEYSILKCDLYQQYINFLCYLREIILNNKSIAISWNLGLANNFYTTFAYYLISPLNLLAVFFNYSNMDVFVEIITGIKIVLMANFMILFLQKSYNYNEKEATIFGLIYAYSSYAICYSFHIMWLDCLYMLPIILIFVDQYLKNGKIFGLVISMSYTILTNYYIGYIVAFFAGIYYLARTYITRTSIKKIIKFLFALGVSFGIGMIVIFPSLLQLKGKMSANTEIIKIEPEKIKLFINVIFNNYVYMFTQKSCFVFSSTLTLVLLPMYYLNENIRNREKYAFTIIIFFLLLPIISPFFNRLWHCFTIPNCFNYRYSFTLIFTLILMSAREFQNKEYSKKWHYLVSLLVFIMLTLIEILCLNKGYLQSDGYTVSMHSILISCIIYIIMYFICFIPWQRWSYYVLLLVVILDLLIGAKSGQNNNDKYFKRETVMQYDNFMNYFMKKIKVSETERIIFEPDKYGSNMSLKYGYSNIGFFTSARNRETLKAMYRMGYNVQMDEQLWITSYSGTFINYGIAGVKYYVSKEKKDVYGFEFKEKFEDFYIYENKNKFNIGYYLKSNIEQSYNPFKMQNELLNGLIFEDKSKEYFKQIENSDCLNVSKQVDGNRINYRVEAKKDCSIYIASDYNLQLYINNKPQFNNYSNIWSTETGVKQIKHLRENEKFEFTIETNQNLELLYIFVSNNQEIQKIIDTPKENNFSNVVINKNGLTGVADFKDDGYLTFSIAYDKCWSIYVDGEKTNTEAISGAFLGVKLKKGVHRIEIKASIL